MTISDAGHAGLSEVIRKSAFNYLQTAALASQFAFQWPAALETTFVGRGPFPPPGSTVSPDCTTRMDAADLFYAKQIAFLFVPPALIVLA